MDSSTEPVKEPKKEPVSEPKKEPVNEPNKDFYRRHTIRQAIIDLLRVKSLITLMVIGSMVYLVVTDFIDPATFMTLAGSVITYYFTKRDSE
jgi:uncharacterized membrane protein